MKRTNLVLDEQLLETATQLLGMKTYSATVNQALKEAIRSAQVQQLSQFIGKGIWAGDLSEMREDDYGRSRSRKSREPRKRSR